MKEAHRRALNQPDGIPSWLGPIAAGEGSPAHLAPRFDASLVACGCHDEQGSIRIPTPTPLGGVNRLTLVLRPRRHPWFVWR
jgi:hypothetical protein